MTTVFRALFLPPVGVGESRDDKALSSAGEKVSPALALAPASKGVSVLVVSASFVDGIVDSQKGRGMTRSPHRFDARLALALIVEERIVAGVGAQFFEPCSVGQITVLIVSRMR